MGGSERRHLRQKIWLTSTNSGTTSKYTFGQKCLPSCTAIEPSVQRILLPCICIFKCVEGAVLESEWPVEQGPGKVEQGEGKRKSLKENNVQLEPPLCEKATQNRSKTFKVL